MLRRTVTSLAFGAACLTAAATLPTISAQAANLYIDAAASPQQNIRQSERYDRLVATDPAFRRMRMRIECGPITDPALYRQCVQSFQQEVQAWNSGQTQAFYRSSASYPSSAG